MIVGVQGKGPDILKKKKYIFEKMKFYACFYLCFKILWVLDWYPTNWKKLTLVCRSQTIIKE